MTITNEEDREFSLSGSLCTNYEIDGMDLSDLLREELGIENLFVFDGNDKPDEVNRITIDYNRHSQIKTGTPLNGRIEHVMWDYSEHIMIDRTTEKLTYIQDVGSDCRITREYQVKDGITDLLDSMDADSLFDYIEGRMFRQIWATGRLAGVCRRDIVFYKLLWSGRVSKSNQLRKVQEKKR